MGVAAVLPYKKKLLFSCLLLLFYIKTREKQIVVVASKTKCSSRKVTAVGTTRVTKPLICRILCKL